jgi:hypothetical protein
MIIFPTPSEYPINISNVLDEYSFNSWMKHLQVYPMCMLSQVAFIDLNIVHTRECRLTSGHTRQLHVDYIFATIKELFFEKI